MSGVSDIGKILSQQYLLASLRGQLNEAQRQSTTGKKSTTNAGLGTMGVANAVAYRNKTNVLNAYKENIEGAKTRMQVMDAAMSSVTEDVRKVLTTLRSQLQGTDPKASIISDEAKTMLANVVSKLNEQVGGKYVFSGDQIYDAPVDDLAALNTSMSGLVAGWLTGTTSAAVITDARAVTGTGLGLNSNLSFAGDVTFRAGDNLDINYTVRGDQEGFQDILRGLAIISNLPQPTTPVEQTNYWNIVNGVITMLDEGAVAIDTAQGLLGNRARLADDLLVEHDETEATFDEFIGTVEDVDMAEASTIFLNLKSQLEASYNIMASIRDLSLVNYL